MQFDIKLNDEIQTQEVVDIYSVNRWSASEKPQQLLSALRASHSLVTARVSGKLVGLANAISDGHLVVYFPHLLVHPNYQRQGIGRSLMTALLEKYAGFHQLMLIADAQAANFYSGLGFEKAGNTMPMWVYAGNEH